MREKNSIVIGTNVSKSLSPTIFNYWFEKYKIVGNYNFKEIKEEKFNQDIKKTLIKNNLCGINITIPFKEKILNFSDHLDRHSKKIGAANCLTKVGKKFYASNTDWIGFSETIKWHEHKWKKKIENKKTAIVIGYGGSAKAIVYSLILMGFKKIEVFNRSYKKIPSTKKISGFKLVDLNKRLNNNVGILINTIPVNYKKEPVIKKHNKKALNETFGFDVVYNYKTFFMDHINKNKRIYGHHMLIHQAIPCFFKWFGVVPEVDKKLLNLLEKKIKKLTKTIIKKK